MTLEYYSMPGFLIRRLHQISISVFEDKTRSAGFDLTPVQYSALNALEEYPSIDQKTLAGLIAHDRVTIGGVVDRLVSKGYAIRSVNPNDRRSKAHDITPSGRKLLAAIRPYVLEAQKTMLTGLTKQERKALMELMKKTVAEGNALSRAPLTELD